MKYKTTWLVLILIAAGLQLSGCIALPAKAKKTAPASVSKIEGTDLMRLTLLPDAAKRLDIQTAPVREETIASTWQTGGQVVSVSPDNTAVVRLYLSEYDAARVRQGEPAVILPLARDSNAPNIKALPLPQPSALGLDERFGTSYYQVSSAMHGLVFGELVLIQLTLEGSGEKRKIIPYAAVLYDSKGNTWVYTSPEPLVFIRQPIDIDTIAGDEALLFDGTPAGTAVVTVGGAELYGTEFGVGK